MGVGGGVHGVSIDAQMLGEIGVRYALTHTPLAAQPRARDAA